MKSKITYLLLFSFITIKAITIFSSESKPIYSLLNKKNIYTANDSVLLNFSTNTDGKPSLYVTNSYGSTLIQPTLTNNVLKYKIPKSFSSKKGILHWKLLDNKASLEGSIKIKSLEQVKNIETYIGPPSINAGKTDYSMIVVIPTESLDNPIRKNEEVIIKHQFLNKKYLDVIKTDNLIAYKNIYSKDKDGRLLISSECKNTASKEFTVFVKPSIPKPFNIYSERTHNYADGNQITTLKTSIIKDNYNNIVSDGTYVTFYISDKNNNKLQTTGTTINGIATAKIINPDHEDSWSIKAYIDGITESNLITLKFEQVVKNIPYTITNNNRTITVGPIKSFMNQFIPDGLEVQLVIKKDNDIINIIEKTSFNGYVTFNLKDDIYKDDIYNLTIKTAGLTKNIKDLKLW